jgi:hypothetical protein
MTSNLYRTAATDGRTALAAAAEDGSPRSAVVSVRSLSKRYGEVVATA